MQKIKILIYLKIIIKNKLAATIDKNKKRGNNSPFFVIVKQFTFYNI